jgi:hypothetical protein
VANLTLAEVRTVLATELAADREVLTMVGPRAFLEKTFAQAGVADARIVEPQ